ncbi:MAG: peptidylprolyl isomerase [Salinivirgaceae bacterium]
MKHKSLIILLFFVSSFSFLTAQTNSDNVLLTIGNKDVSLEEFERIYTKNNQEPAYDKASLEEYMELFVNFKLKVMEAEALGMDTLPAFISELKGYRKQLEKPYFTDEDTDEALIREAYERMKWNIRASHILITCNEDALPADTLKAYNKIKKIRQRAIKGEDFAELAVQNSEDPSVVNNKGDLGYFTAFSMVYPFESGAYNTKVGEISEIVRTRFGYHIIKVADKRPDKGQVKVAHIMRAVPQGSNAEKVAKEREKIYQLYDSLQAGANFEDLVRTYSDDRGTSARGGELPYFQSGRMIPEFEKAAFSIAEVGGISEPVQTAYGWHIVKLIDKKPLDAYDVLKPSIKSKISKDVRAQRAEQMVINRLKNEYRLALNKKAIEVFYSLVDSSIYEGNWTNEKIKNLSEPVFTIADTLVYTQADFAEFLAETKSRRVKKPIPVLIDTELERMVETKLRDYETHLLPAKHPEFKHLLQEYHDGILLFNLTDKMVWSKAVEDTVGLEKYYELNRQNYLWGERADATIYTFNNKAFEKKIIKLAKKTGKKNTNLTQLKVDFNSRAMAKDSTFSLDITNNLYEKGANEWVDAVSWKPGIKTVVNADNKYILVYINRVVAPEPKELSDVRGLITADYQNFLEKEWLKELREKYPVSIHQEVFNAMVKP